MLLVTQERLPTLNIPQSSLLTQTRSTVVSMSSFEKIPRDQYPQPGKSYLPRDLNALKKEGRDFLPRGGQSSTTTTGVTKTDATGQRSNKISYSHGSGSLYKFEGK